MHPPLLQTFPTLNSWERRTASTRPSTSTLCWSGSEHPRSSRKSPSGREWRRWRWEQEKLRQKKKTHFLKSKCQKLQQENCGFSPPEQTDDSFRSRFSGLLKEQVDGALGFVTAALLSTVPNISLWPPQAKGGGYFFEMPGVSAASASERPFQFALVGDEGGELEGRREDTNAFSQHFERWRTKRQIKSFGQENWLFFVGILGF